MKWNCNKCNREVISSERKEFCLECGWKSLVEKIEINPETIRSFMEKHYFTYFKFNKGDYDDFLEIGVHRNTISPWLSPHSDYSEREGTYYYPKSKRNTIRNRDRGEKYYNEYSAFLEKLFQFAEKEKIKRIRANYSIELKIDEKLNKHMEVKRVIFKVSDLIIEKKTAQELEKEEYKI